MFVKIYSCAIYALLLAVPASAKPLNGEQMPARSPQASRGNKLMASAERAVLPTSLTTALGPTITSDTSTMGPASRWSSVLPAKLLAKLWTDPDTIPSFGWDRPLNNSPPLSFGFWPVTWSTNTPEGGSPSGESRPGGFLFSFGISPNVAYIDGTSISYVVYGDAESLSYMAPSVGYDCDGTVGLGPNDLTTNVTLQSYRDASMVFMRVNNPLGPNNLNETFETCVNQSIARNLLITGYSSSMGHGNLCASSVLAIVSMFGLFSAYILV